MASPGERGRPSPPPPPPPRAGNWLLLLTVSSRSAQFRAAGKDPLAWRNTLIAATTCACGAGDRGSHPLCSSPSSLSLLTTAKEGHASLLVEPAALTFNVRVLSDNRRARRRRLALPPPRHGRRGVRRRGRAPEGRRPHRRARATADPPGRPRPPRRHLYPPRAPSLPRLGRPPPSSRPGSCSQATLTRSHTHRATSALSKSATGPASRTTTSGSSSSPPGSPSSRPCSSPSASPRPGSRPRTPSSAVQHSGRAT